MKFTILIILIKVLLFDIVADDSLKLPNPLVALDGKKITTIEDWQKIRRPEILELFRENVYGRNPVDRPQDLHFENVETNNQAMNGKATLKIVNIIFSGKGGKGKIKLIIFIPNKKTKPAPGFLLICNRDPENIDPTREKISPFWPAEKIIEQGYAAMTFHNSDLDPDIHDNFQNGVHGIFDSKTTVREPDAWGTIAAWAWGASRVMDYLETDKDIDAKHIGVIGHSRGGKTALWCGAQDERFALVISNNSGCTGAALSRNKKGESIKKINKSFPHWFCTNYKKFDDKEDELPIDQHELIALIAPRLVYVSSASKDEWADPKNEFLSCVYATPVYELFGLKGVETKEMPKTDQPLHSGFIGHHIREGKHDLTEYDWNYFMKFADIHWKSNK